MFARCVISFLLLLVIAKEAASVEVEKSTESANGTNNESDSSIITSTGEPDDTSTTPPPATSTTAPPTTPAPTSPAWKLQSKAVRRYHPDSEYSNDTVVSYVITPDEEPDYDVILNHLAVNDLLKETIMTLNNKLETFVFAPRELHLQTMDLDSKQNELVKKLNDLRVNPEHTEAEIGALSNMVNKLGKVLAHVQSDQNNISGSIEFGKQESLVLLQKMVTLENALEYVEKRFKLSPPVQTVFHNQRVVKSTAIYLHKSVINIRSKTNQFEMHNKKMDKALIAVQDRKDHANQVIDRIAAEVKSVRNTLQELQDPTSEVNNERTRQMHDMSAGMDVVTDLHGRLKELSRHSADNTLHMLKKLEVLQAILKANKEVAAPVKKMMNKLLKNDREMALVKEMNRRKMKLIRESFRKVLADLQMREINEMDTIDRIPNRDHH